MFKNLQETIKALNADVKTVTNSEKAKKLRRKLLIIGLTLSIVGFLGVIICFSNFATAGFDAMDSNTIPSDIITPFLLFAPFGIIAVIGCKITSIAFKIVITGYTTNLVDTVVGNNCPSCGKTIDSDMLFCSKCGTKLKKECPNCKHVNNHKSDYCEKCGYKLG